MTDSPGATEINGHCPMGCGETLWARWGPAGSASIECGSPNCPRPDALNIILADARVDAHIVVFEPESFSIQHPIKERLEGDLFTCPLFISIAKMDGPPAAPGRYTAVEHRDPHDLSKIHYEFERLPLEVVL